MRALLYTRVSHEDQVKFGISLDAQLEDLQRYCKDNDLPIGGTYSDEGISGGSIVKRLSFQQMIQDAKPGDIILFTRLDRFSRNLLDANIIVKELDKKKVSIKAINEDDIDTSTADGRFIFNLKLSLAEREREKTSERIKDVFDYKIKNGEITNNSIPYGYKVENKHLVIDTEKVDKVKEFFNYYEKHQNMQKLSKWWNTTYPEEAIGISALRERLRDPIYVGKHQSGRNNNFCEPIIDETQFNHIQSLMDKNIRFKANGGRVYMFTRMITCTCCGSHLSGTYYPRGDKEFKQYRCMKHYSSHICPNNKTLSEKKIEAVLLEDMNKKIGSISLDLELKTKNTPLGNLPQRKKNINSKIERLKNLYIEGLLTKDAFDLKYNSFKSELHDIEVLENKKEIPKFIKEMKDVNFMQLYDLLTEENKRLFWRKFVKEIKYDTNGISDILYY